MSTARSLRSPDRVIRVAPFGVRFWDRAGDAPILEGLTVTLWPSADPRLRLQAAPNRSGVHVLHAFPGLGAVTRGEMDLAASPLTRREVTIEVIDTRGRFLPVRLTGSLPSIGLFAPDCAGASPPGRDTTIELYLAPTGMPPSAFAVLRAELRFADERPVRWALVTASYRGVELGQGLSDPDGKLLLVFPYPELAQPRVGSPPASPIGSPPSLPPLRAAARWDITLLARHSPAVSVSEVPDYCALRAQPPARLLASSTPPTELAAVAIELGRPTVVASEGESHLYLVAA